MLPWGAEGHDLKPPLSWTIFTRFHEMFFLQRLARAIVLKVLLVRWYSTVQRKILDITALILVQRKQQTAIEIVRNLFDLVFQLITATLNVSLKNSASLRPSCTVVFLVARINVQPLMLRSVIGIQFI